MDQASTEIDTAGSSHTPSTNAEAQTPYLPPVSIIDTSALMRIRDGNNDFEEVVAMLQEKFGNDIDEEDVTPTSFAITDLLRWLSDKETKPPRTLIIPNEVLRELFPSRRDNQEFAQGIKKDDGKLSIHIQTEHLIKPSIGKRSMANFINKLADNGSIRIYDQFDDMIAKGEIAKPKGGIVILDSNLANLPEEKRLNDNGEYQPYLKDIQAGDRAILKSCKELAAYYPSGIFFPIIASDGGFTKLTKEKDGRPVVKDPFAMNLRSMVTALRDQGIIDEPKAETLFEQVTSDKRLEGDSTLDIDRPTSMRQLSIDSFRHWFEHLSEPREGVTQEKMSNGFEGR